MPYAGLALFRETVLLHNPPKLTLKDKVSQNFPASQNALPKSYFQGMQF